MSRSLLPAAAVVAALLAAPCDAQRPAVDSVATSPAPVAARDTGAPARRPAGGKSPALAGVLGVYPGLGHAYAGEWERGLQVYAGTFGPLAAGAFTMIASPPNGSCFALECGEGRPPRWVTRVVFAGGVAVAAVGVANWVRGALDAPRAARRTNRRRGLSLAPRLRPDVYVAAHPDGTAQVGVALSR